MFNIYYFRIFYLFIFLKIIENYKIGNKNKEIFKETKRKYITFLQNTFIYDIFNYIFSELLYEIKGITYIKISYELKLIMKNIWHRKIRKKIFNNKIAIISFELNN